jgi:hypothetical protein
VREREREREERKRGEKERERREREREERKIVEMRISLFLSRVLSFERTNNHWILQYSPLSHSNLTSSHHNQPSLIVIIK